MRSETLRWPAVLVLVLGLAAGCAAGQKSVGAPDPRATAATEATALLLRAEATAILVRAQATANALVAPIPPPSSTPRPPRAPAATAEPGRVTDKLLEVATSLPAGGVAPAPVAPATPAPVGGEPTLAGSPNVTGTGKVEVASLGFAADGAWLIVRFFAPPMVARGWFRGALSVTDEATGTVYNQIPVLPLMGPMLAHPGEEDVPGYFMLVNSPPGLKEGSRVTVAMGDYKTEHVIVAP